MSEAQPGGGSTQGESSSSSDAQSAYNDLRRLIPSLAAELELLRTSLREHSLWLLRYGHGNNLPPTDQPPAATAAASSTASTSSSSSSQVQQQPPSTQQGSSPPPAPTGPPPAFSPDPEPPAYSASDVPPYQGGLSTVSASTREEVQARRDQLASWLSEGEDVLREYSARHAQLAAELGLPNDEDLLGTWHEAHPDNALPGYVQVERNEELMVGGVGEVPPPYLGGRVTAASAAAAAVASSSGVRRGERASESEDVGKGGSSRQ